MKLSTSIMINVLHLTKGGKKIKQGNIKHRNVKMKKQVPIKKKSKKKKAKFMTRKSRMQW